VHFFSMSGGGRAFRSDGEEERTDYLLSFSSAIRCRTWPRRKGIRDFFPICREQGRRDDLGVFHGRKKEILIVSLSHGKVDKEKEGVSEEGGGKDHY